MNVHFLQHVPFEGLASIRGWIDRGGHSVACTRLYAGDGLPDPQRVDLLIVMGGPMGVHDLDQYPWLAAEKAFLRAVIAAGKRVLGICLGAQLIADVLGARVYSNGQKEIGWFGLTRSATATASRLGEVLPATFDAYHWHGDTFDLPPGAVHLACSGACKNQAFAIEDRILALQFHLETTLESAHQLIEHCGDELNESSPTIQSAELMLSRTAHFQQLNALMFRLLDTLTRQDP